MKNFRVKRLGHLPKVTVAKWQNLDSNPHSVSRGQLAVRREGDAAAPRRPGGAAWGCAGCRWTVRTALHTGQWCKLQFKCDLLYFSLQCSQSEIPYFLWSMIEGIPITA